MAASHGERELFDIDHERLISHINRLCEKLTQNSPPHEAIFLVSEIHAAVAAHFKTEEDLMRRYQDSNYSAHKVDHDDLLEEIRRLLDRTESELEGNLGKALSARCGAWFADHFEEHDTKLMRYSEAVKG